MVCDRSALPLVRAELTRRGNSNVLASFLRCTGAVLAQYRDVLQQAGDVVGHMCKVPYAVKKLLAGELEYRLPCGTTKLGG